MDQRPLGRTGLKVTPLALGLAALGRPGYITAGRQEDIPRRDRAAMLAQSVAVLDAAWAGGIRHFDAARSYGLAEDFLARWLAMRGIAPEAVTVSSKWGYAYVGDWLVNARQHEVKDLSVAQFRRQQGESASLLGPWLRLYQVHSLTIETGALEDAALLDALAGLKSEGVAVGFSTSGPRQAETILRALERQVDGVPLFDAVQATWNLRERSAEAALAAAAAAGLGVIVKEAVANGSLTGRSLAKWPEPWARALLRLAGRVGAGADAVAIAAALSRPWAHAVLSGAATPAQVASNLEALRLGERIAAEAMEAVPAMDPERYWQARSALPWT